MVVCDRPNCASKHIWLTSDLRFPWIWNYERYKNTHASDLSATCMNISGYTNRFATPEFLAAAVIQPRQKCISLPRIGLRLWFLYVDNTFVIIECLDTEFTKPLTAYSETSNSLWDRRRIRNGHFWTCWRKEARLRYHYMRKTCTKSSPS